jgi:DNA-binding protein YbaB
VSPEVQSPLLSSYALTTSLATEDKLTQSVPPDDGAGDPFAALNARIEEMQTKAAAAQEQLENAVATAQSPDGAVSVTLGATGALKDLKFGARAYERPPQALAGLVMQLIGRAQQKVSAEVSEAFGGLVGEDSAAMEVLEEFLPAPAEDEEEPPPAEDTLEPEQEAEDRTPPPPARGPQQPIRQPRRRPRPDDDEDEDYDEIRPW